MSPARLKKWPETHGLGGGSILATVLELLMDFGLFQDCLTSPPHFSQR
jgi:hypothetical protein